MPFFPDLKKEVTLDPLGVGYSTMSDQEVADSLNLQDEVEWGQMTASQLFNVINDAEWDALAPKDRAAISEVLALSGEFSVDPQFRVGSRLSVFPANGPTMRALQGRARADASRAQQLGLRRVRAMDVSRVR